MNINGYNLPNPDDVGQSEYRVLYDFLADTLADSLRRAPSDDAAAEEAVALLYGVQDWCVVLLADIQATIGKEVNNE